MALPEFSMRQLMEAGAHFGHQVHRWNPKMKPYIFGARSGIHILDLSFTVPLLHQALVKARDVVADGGRILFVGTKHQAADAVSTAAQRCAQYYMNHRWLGGTLTNWTTISNSIKRLRDLDDITQAGSSTGLTKKELLGLHRERTKLQRTLGGIREMSGPPDLMVVIDTNKEHNAIRECRKLGIPVIAPIDSNCDPDEVDFPIPGNDDAAKAIHLYCRLLADAALDGLEASGMYDNGPVPRRVVPSDSPLQRARLAVANQHQVPVPEFGAYGLEATAIVTEGSDVILEARAKNTQTFFEATFDKDYPSQGGIYRWEFEGDALSLFPEILQQFSRETVDQLHVDLVLPKRAQSYERTADTIFNNEFETLFGDILRDNGNPNKFTVSCHFPPNVEGKFELVISSSGRRTSVLLASRGDLPYLELATRGIASIIERSHPYGTGTGQDVSSNLTTLDASTQRH